MGIAERKQAEADALKRKILTAATQLLEIEGYENLSIRKIATKIDYSPAIIYHYFKDKAEILCCIVDSGYKEILKQISSVEINLEDPSETLFQTLTNYISLMLKNSELFKILLSSDINEIQSKVGMLEKGISTRRESIFKLVELIKLGIEKNIFRKTDAELTAQIIWTSTYGLISRMILEKNIPKAQKNRLIAHHIEFLSHGLKNRKD